MAFQIADDFFFARVRRSILIYHSIHRIIKNTLAALRTTLIPNIAKICFLSYNFFINIVACTPMYVIFL